ncbi:MAG TPA: UvrD-helicase domain-containing protein [Ktedonobacteraceae bacterium]|nr:UvrD-helicase domain-containing protein [Ktedonobacteraceae bacterium]
MAQQWQVMMKPSFMQGIVALPGKEMHQVMEKVNMLMLDPLPDGKVKKQIKHAHKKRYRIRSGAYRILYTFDKQFVSVLTIRRRREDTYDDMLDDEDEQWDEVEDLDADDALDGSPGPAVSGKAAQPNWETIFAPKNKPLPEPITPELLQRLRVPREYHPRLLPLKTQEELLACPGVADDVLLQIDAYMFEKPLIQVEQQPNYMLNAVEDLLRYKEGELLSFLLKLSPDQEKYVSWAIDAKGPTLVKGSPGTGKSTVALYRIRSMLGQLRKMGIEQPRILFTTYTNALVRSSEQLLEQLLGEDARFVTVLTADKIAYDILKQNKQVKEIIESGELQKLTRQAAVEAIFEGNLLQQQSQRQTIERMGCEYLLQELNSVIVARQLTKLVEYQKTPRNGRKMPLNPTQRWGVWKVYERWCELLRQSGRETWQQRRSRAEMLFEQGSSFQRYDAVVVDEAQDLDPSLLRLLVKLCISPTHLFITADANQSIYGSGFNWSDVHTSLKFQGRTSILRTNYRSTRELGDATQSYLTYGELEPEATQPQYVNSGPTPDVRAVLNNQHEAQLLASFFKKAVLSLRLAMGSCAVLCPNERVGREIASALSRQGLEATFMKGSELNLTRPGIKVLTLSSSKGLEFPIVALAGFTGIHYPYISAEASDDEQAEQLARERRVLFVGMTRAMRALLVITPTGSDSPLFEGFVPTFWNMTRMI